MHRPPHQNAQLISAVYDAAHEAGRWPAVWSGVCSAFAASTGVLFRQADDEAQAQVIAQIQDAAGTATPFAVPRARSLRQAVQLNDQTYMLGAVTPVAGTELAGMGLHRPRVADPFTAEDAASLDTIGEHIAAALRLENLLAAAREATAMRDAVLDHLAHGAVICDGNAALLYANEPASRLCRDGGLILAALGGQVMADNAASHENLLCLITRAAKGAPGGNILLRRAGRRRALALTVTTLPAGMGHGLPRAAGRAVLITIRDLGATAEASQAQLMELFGLTAAEAGIIPQVVAGDTARLIAMSRGVAQATVRDQVNRILAKTGAPNQRALAAMISTLGAA